MEVPMENKNIFKKLNTSANPFSNEAKTLFPLLPCVCACPCRCDAHSKNNGYNVNVVPLAAVSIVVP